MATDVQGGTAEDRRLVEGTVPSAWYLDAKSEADQLRRTVLVLCGVIVARLDGAEALHRVDAVNEALDHDLEAQFQRAEALEAERDTLREALEQLAEWAANRERNSAASDMSREEERGWNLALSGLEYRARTALSVARCSAADEMPAPTSMEAK